MRLPPSYKAASTPRTYTVSVHHHHHAPALKPKTPTFHSRINRHGLSNNSPISPEHHHLTPLELVVLLFALGILVALVSWLVWIMLEFCIALVKEKFEDMDLGKRMRKDRHRDEETPGRAVHASEVLGKMGLSSLVDIGGKIFGGRQDWEGRRGLGEDERGLFGGNGDGHERGGYGISDGRTGYGYHEGMLYPSGAGQDRLKYMDGMSETSGCVGPLHGHKEECVGECTLQTRRRSRDS